MSDDPITFSELDALADLDPLSLTVENLDRLIAGMRAYRANALGKGGKATKFSDEAGIKATDIMAALKKSNALGKVLPQAPKEKMRRI